MGVGGVGGEVSRWCCRGLGGNNRKGSHKHNEVHQWWTKLFLGDGRNLSKKMIAFYSWKDKNNELKKMHWCLHRDPLIVGQKWKRTCFHLYSQIGNCILAIRFSTYTDTSTHAHTHTFNRTSSSSSSLSGQWLSIYKDFWMTWVYF